jgi:hypothetical protein
MAPGAGTYRLRVELPAAMPVRLELFDLRGRRVRTLVHRELPAGVRTESWDLLDDAGRRVAPGVYYARLDTPRGGRALRVVTLSSR